MSHANADTAEGWTGLCSSSRGKGPHAGHGSMAQPHLQGSHAVWALRPLALGEHACALTARRLKGRACARPWGVSALLASRRPRRLRAPDARLLRLQRASELTSHPQTDEGIARRCATLRFSLRLAEGPTETDKV